MRIGRQTTSRPRAQKPWFAAAPEFLLAESENFPSSAHKIVLAVTARGIAPCYEAHVVSKVLLALDDSRCAPRVGSVGALIAARFGASLHPVRVIPMRANASTSDAIPEQQLREAMAALNDQVKSFMDALVAPPRMRVGEPWRVILELATEAGADLIVIGARGHGEQALGSTAANVLAHAAQNVFVVRDLGRHWMISDRHSQMPASQAPHQAESKSHK